MANFFEEEPKLFNAEAVDLTDEAVICRDTDEVSLLMESGVVGGMTVTGANTTGKWLKVLSENADGLTKLRKITLAIPDSQLREELARRLGRHRCWLVDRPLAGTYAEGSAMAVLEALEGATPYPIQGVQRLKPGALLQLRRQPPPTVMTTGTVNSDALLKLPTEGRLIVITGVPSHGKTSWTRFVMMHTADKHKRRWCVFSPESQPWEEFVAQCAEARVGKPFFPIDGIETMTEAEIAEAEAFLDGRVTMLVCDAEDEAPTLEWVLERARACVLRYGVTDLLIDPWNEVEQVRGEMNETDYIGRSLQRLKSFAFRHGCNVWVVAHPSKPAPTRPNEKPAVPGPYSINGSSHWANKTDIGITIHSPDPDLAQLHLWKSRMRRWGKRSLDPAIMEFNPLAGVYRNYTKPDPAAAAAKPDPGLWEQ